MYSNPSASVDADDLVGHNQFLLGPEPSVHSGGWPTVRVAAEYHLTVHPDLNLTQIGADGISLTLIGFMLNPHDPEATDSDVLQEVLKRLSTGQSHVDATIDLGGRWVLVIETPTSLDLITDAVGHRQVFYTQVGDGGPLWCASQPLALAEITDRGISPEAKGLIDSYVFRKYSEYRWPGYDSPYHGIHHLLPNHRLDLKTGACLRYWPDRPLPTMDMEAAVPAAAKILEGSLMAAARRFDLAVSLTAGLDSRVVCAAARGLFPDTPLVTVRQIDKPADHADVTVAAQIAQRMGCRHDVAQSSLIIDDDFLAAFKQATALPHYIYLPDAQAIYKLYKRQRAVATGSMSEIGRLSFRKAHRKPETEPIDAHDLARLQKMDGQPYALSAFDKWLSGIGEHYNLPLLDLFEWEQGHGNWLAMCHMEFDIAWRELFTPFNCRQLLMILLGVDRRHRDSPDYTLYRNIIAHLWPELLSVPINPHDISPRPTLRRRLASRIPYRWKQQIKGVLNMN